MGIKRISVKRLIVEVWLFVLLLVMIGTQYEHENTTQSIPAVSGMVGCNIITSDNIACPVNCDDFRIDSLAARNGHSTYDGDMCAPSWFYSDLSVLHTEKRIE